MSQFIFPPLTASLDSEQTNGGSLPAKQMVMAGFDSTATRALLTDSSGRLEINAVVSLPLPSGAATAALQTAGNNLLTTIDADTSLLSGAVKNIQSAQGTTDAGLPALVVRNDTLADLSGADGDYTPLQVNATGALYTTVSTGSIDVTSIVPGTGATNLGKAIQSAQGTTDTGVPALVVRNDTLADLSGADGDYAPLQVNASGALYTEVKTSALPSGAATEAKQDVIETTLNSIEGDTSSLAGAVSGTEMQVDVVASLPAGTNAIGKLAANSGVDIGDVDVTSLPSLPAGTNNIGDVDIASALPAGTNSIGTVVLGAGSATIGKLSAIAPVDFLDSGLVDTSTANIASTGTTVVSSLAAACTEIEIQEDIGEFMSLRVGGTVKAYLPLGGGRVKVSLAATSAVQLYSETGTAISSGKIAINFLG